MSSNNFAEDQAAIPKLVVSGSGEVAQSPDMAEVNVGVVTEAPSADQALQANNRQMEQLISTLKSAGIGEKQIQTTSFDVSPQYEQSREVREGPLTIVGYRVSNQVQIRAAIERLGAILDKAVTAGANQIHGISFSISETEQLMDQARRMAVRDAQQKAKSMADEAGLRLGEIIEIRDEVLSHGPPSPRMGMMEARASVPIQAGETRLTATVQLTFKLESQ